MLGFYQPSILRLAALPDPLSVSEPRPFLPDLLGAFGPGPSVSPATLPFDLIEYLL